MGNEEERKNSQDNSLPLRTSAPWTLGSLDSALPIIRTTFLNGLDTFKCFRNFSVLKSSEKNFHFKQEES